MQFGEKKTRVKQARWRNGMSTIELNVYSAAWGETNSTPSRPDNLVCTAWRGAGSVFLLSFPHVWGMSIIRNVRHAERTFDVEWNNYSLSVGVCLRTGEQVTIFGIVVSCDQFMRACVWSDMLCKLYVNTLAFHSAVILISGLFSFEEVLTLRLCYCNTATVLCFAFPACYRGKVLVFRRKYLVT
jgi:hypothetical protein